MLVTPSREYFRGQVNNSKHRAKRLGVPHALSPEYLASIYPKDGLCPVLRVPLSRAKGRGKGRERSPSLDRRIAEDGYVIGNVSFICNQANRLKGSLSIEELERLVAYAKGTTDAQHPSA